MTASTTCGCLDRHIKCEYVGVTDKLRMRHLKLAGKFLNFPSLVCSLFLKVEGCLCLCCFSTEPEGSVAALYSQKHVDTHRFKGDFFPYEKH